MRHFVSPIREVFQQGEDGKTIRYVLRRNPLRAQQIQANRQSKKETVYRLVETKNTYLTQHQKASVKIAMRKALCVTHLGG